MCACAPLGALISCHVSSVFLISSPQGTGELLTHQYSFFLPTVSLCCIIWLCPIDDTDLCLYFTVLHILYLLPLSHHPFSQRPKRITKSPWHFYFYFYWHCFFLLNFSGVIVQTGHRGDCRYFLRLGARQNPWKKDYGGRQSFSGGGYWRGTEPAWLSCVFT